MVSIGQLSDIGNGTELNKCYYFAQVSTSGFPEHMTVRKGDYETEALYFGL